MGFRDAEKGNCIGFTELLWEPVGPKRYAACDNWADELCGCRLILWALLGDSSVGLGWVPHQLERMELLVGMEILPFSGSRFWP